MKYKYILFDWDGSLAHSLPAWLDTYKKLLTEHKISMEDAQIVKHIMPKPQNATTYGITDFESFYEKLREMASITVPYSPLHNQVEETIRTLNKMGAKLAIVTSSRLEIIHKALTQHNLHSYFDAVVTGDDVKRKKPDPEVLFIAMERMGADKDSTIMVGDTEGDILAGKAAGITTVVHYPKENESFYAQEVIKNLEPDYVITNFKELLKIVQ